MRQMHKSTSISYYLFVFGMFTWLIVFHVLSDVQDTILTPYTQKTNNKPNTFWNEIKISYKFERT